ncbi:hypothetical protein [Haloechinothrix salitolerans]|uniref:Uncharacterized protein n=1 Tax=Haloechinothrix salitolerans TaxID=926830 RepID=A0ABW2CBJ1_9PSEU
MDADDFARSHPELASAVDDATAGQMVEGLYREARNTVLRGLMPTLAVFALLLCGWLWWGWGQWTLIGIGATGAAAAGGLIELYGLATGRIPVVTAIREEGTP